MPVCCAFYFAIAICLSCHCFSSSQSSRKPHFVNELDFSLSCPYVMIVADPAACISMFLVFISHDILIFLSDIAAPILTALLHQHHCWSSAGRPAGRHVECSFAPGPRGQNGCAASSPRVYRHSSTACRIRTHRYNVALLLLCLTVLCLRSCVCLRSYC